MVVVNPSVAATSIVQIESPAPDTAHIDASRTDDVTDEPSTQIEDDLPEESSSGEESTLSSPSDSPAAQKHPVASPSPEILESTAGNEPTAHSSTDRRERIMLVNGVLGI